MSNKKLIDIDSLSRYHTNLNNVLSGKQDSITDLETIREGAALGATALQSYTEEYQGTVGAIDTDDKLDDVESLPYVKYVAQSLNEEQQQQVWSNIGLLSPYEFYKSVGGILNERQYKIMVRYAYTPFMISSNSVTTLPDELLNESKTNFFADWYWNIVRITGGEPIMTIQWNNNIPYRIKGIVSGKTYVINFDNKTITPES